MEHNKNIASLAERLADVAYNDDEAITAANQRVGTFDAIEYRAALAKMFQRELDMALSKLQWRENLVDRRKEASIKAAHWLTDADREKFGKYTTDDAAILASVLLTGSRELPPEAIMDAVTAQLCCEGIVAWPGDATSCVAQVIERYRKTAASCGTGGEGKELPPCECEKAWANGGQEVHAPDCHYATPTPSGEREKALDYKTLYHELLYAVGKKWPGESRHQTALRYIQRAEAPNHRADAAAKENAIPVPGGTTDDRK